MIKAVIFDMDGLLIDSEPFWRYAHMSVLAEDGFIISEEDVRNMAGKGTNHVVEEWQKRFGWSITDNSKVETRIVARVKELVSREGKELPGVLPLITTLYEHHIPMAVASSSSTELITTVLSKLGIYDFMQAIHSGRDEIRSKPFPDVFIATAQSLGMIPDDCLVFEDSLNGVKAAKAAGMKCIAVPDQFFDRAMFEQAHPERIIGSLEEIRWADIQAL